MARGLADCRHVSASLFWLIAYRALQCRNIIHADCEITGTRVLRRFSDDLILRAGGFLCNPPLRFVGLRLSFARSLRYRVFQRRSPMKLSIGFPGLLRRNFKYFYAAYVHCRFTREIQFHSPFSPFNSIFANLRQLAPLLAEIRRFPRRRGEKNAALSEGYRGPS